MGNEEVNEGVDGAGEEGREAAAGAAGSLGTGTTASGVGRGLESWFPEVAGVEGTG